MHEPNIMLLAILYLGKLVRTPFVTLLTNSTKTYSKLCKDTYIITYLLTYSLTHLLHAAESFLRS